MTAQWSYQHETIGRSALNHLRLVTLLAIIGVLVGVGYGLLRAPVYTAQARLFVGKTLNLNNLGAVAGLANAGSQIASDYSRLITTSTVVSDASKRLGHPGYLGGRLTASPVAQSSIIVVEAATSSAKSAIALANSGSAALVDGVNQINQLAQSQINQLQQDYASKESMIGSLTDKINRLQTQINALNPLTSASEISQLQNQISDANIQIKVIDLQAQADSSQYESQVSSLQGEEQVITPEGAAVPTGSDRKSYLEIGLIAGLVGGLLTGVAFSVLIDALRLRRLAGHNLASARLDSRG